MIGSFYQVAAAWSTQNTITLYFNGKQVSIPTNNVQYSNSFYNNMQSIGSCFCGSDRFYGSVSNLQIYNVSLTANEILGLYQKGFGDAQIDLQHLVGWYPLNGNANDYSGNGQGGVLIDVDYNSMWRSDYTPT